MRTENDIICYLTPGLSESQFWTKTQFSKTDDGRSESPQRDVIKLEISQSPEMPSRRPVFEGSRGGGRVRGGGQSISLIGHCLTSKVKQHPGVCGRGQRTHTKPPRKKRPFKKWEVGTFPNKRAPFQAE